MFLLWCFDLLIWVSLLPVYVGNFGCCGFFCWVWLVVRVLLFALWLFVLWFVYFLLFAYVGDFVFAVFSFFRLFMIIILQLRCVFVDLFNFCVFGDLFCLLFCFALVL